MSELRAATVSNLAGTGPATLTGQTAAKAWVRFNGTGTVAIGASANTSSITDNNTGDYTENFTSAMTDANYGIGGFAGNAAGETLWARVPAAPTVNALRLLAFDRGSGAAADATYANMSALR